MQFRLTPIVADWPVALPSTMKHEGLRWVLEEMENCGRPKLILLDIFK